ncbi:MAG: two pore domain potassium channel family protein [Chloroflexi bacterium]|nr:two pore domain potassium channel family protein [Chloroflexota bacterium]
MATAEAPVAHHELIAFHRETLRQELQDWLDPLMTVLGIMTIVLFMVQLVATLTPRESAWVNDAQGAIWALFIVEFLLEVLLACDRVAYLRSHWLLGITVLLPALRVLRVARALMALRQLNLLWLLMRANRSIQALRKIIPGRETAYLLVLTALVVAVGTAGCYYFEQGQANAQIHTLGDALWWAACLVTTINYGTDPVSPEGRILAILLRIYAVGVFGIVAGNMASVLLLRRQEEANVAAAQAEDPAED